jgi:hypothetical protein
MICTRTAAQWWAHSPSEQVPEFDPVAGDPPQFAGVVQKGQRYAASIRRSDKVVHLGMFDTATAAHAAWLEAARVDHGEFVRAE